MTDSKKLKKKNDGGYRSDPIGMGRYSQNCSKGAMTSVGLIGGLGSVLLLVIMLVFGGFFLMKFLYFIGVDAGYINWFFYLLIISFVLIGVSAVIAKWKDCV